MKPPDIELVAKYLIYKAREKDIVLNITKIHKLMYILHGILLVNGLGYMFDEQCRTWKFGPVYPRVQIMLKDENTKNLGDYDKDFSKLVEEKNFEKSVMEVLNRFGQYTATSLSEWSHKDNSPWKKTMVKYHNNYDQIIKDELILDYFNNFIEPIDSNVNPQKELDF